jgi:hyperosmotically inducible protein
MIGRLVRFIFLVVIIAAGAAYLAGYWQPEWLPTSPALAGSRPVETAQAKERANEAGREIGQAGRELGKKASTAMKQLDEALSDGALTAKIKSKMTLDDTVDASTINVDTANRVVTLKGTVRTKIEKERVLQLARETNGVTRVDDQLSVTK